MGEKQGREVWGQRGEDQGQRLRVGGGVSIIWFRSGRGLDPGCGPVPRGGPPPCGRASCASCVPAGRCGDGAGYDETAGLRKTTETKRRDKSECRLYICISLGKKQKKRKLEFLK